jgi:hypothetical protein
MLSLRVNNIDMKNKRKKKEGKRKKEGKCSCEKKHMECGAPPHLSRSMLHLLRSRTFNSVMCMSVVQQLT